MIQIFPDDVFRLRAFLSGIYPIPAIRCGSVRRTRSTKNKFCSGNPEIGRNISLNGDAARDHDPEEATR